MQIDGFITKVIGVGCALFLVGCQTTPKAVLTLATVTSGNTTKLGTQLTAFADQEAEIAALRAKNLAIMTSELAAVDYQNARHLEAMRLAGQTGPLALYTNLIVSSEKLAVLQESIPQKVEQQRSALLAAQRQLGSPAKDLAAVSKSLAALGKELSFSEWLAFYAAYSQDVDKGIEQQLQQFKDANAKASASNSTVKTNTTTKSP